MELDAIYRESRGRITDLVSSLDETALATPTPACPAWTVHDVLAHLAGATADVIGGRLEGAGGDAWTAAQVEARRHASTEDLLAEWSEHAPALESMIPSVPQMIRLPADCLTHEQDIRGAVGRPGGDPEALAWGAGLMLESWNRRIEAEGLGAIRVRAPGIEERTLGSGDPTSAVTAPGVFEVFRALLGRRSREQVAAWAWDVDPVPYLDGGLFTFGPRPDDLVEQGP